MHFPRSPQTRHFVRIHATVYICEPCCSSHLLLGLCCDYFEISEGGPPSDLFRYERVTYDRCMSVEARVDCFVLGKSEVKAFAGRCPPAIGQASACELADMNRRRWTNNGGFTLRMLEESSPEVTSSSALGSLPPAMVMSPESLNSPSEYAALELWGYEDAYTAQSLLGTCSLQQQQQQMTQPLPSMPLPMPPTTPKSENESMSSG